MISKIYILNFITILRKNLINNKTYLFLIIIVILGYFPISFFLKTLKFDAIYVHFPWRYIIVNSIRSGDLPLWNSFQHLGLPIHADPQTGAWYPIVWFFAFFGKYSLYSFNIEFIFHIIIAALGFYKLLRYYKLSKISCLMGASVYVFSGFFVGHAAHFSWIISIAWIPWIIYYFQRLLYRPNFYNAIWFALLIFMLLTGGYPAFTIILIYSFLVWGLIILYKSNQGIQIIKFVSISLGITILISSDFLVSVIGSIDYFARGNGIDYTLASKYPLNYKTLISLIAPFSAVSIDTNSIYRNFETDISMTNLYIGLFPLLLAFIYIYKNKMWILGLLALFFLLISFGDKLLIHRLLYDYLPGFNLFRFPAIFRFFFMSILIGLGAANHNKIFKEKNFVTLKRAIIVLIILFVLIIVIVNIISSSNWNSNSNLYFFIVHLNLKEQLLLQSFLQIGILSFGLIILKYDWNRKILFTSLIILDLIISLQIYAPYTIYPYKSNLTENQSVIEKANTSFLLENNMNILENSKNINPPYPFDKGFNVYESKISYQGNYSYILKNTQYLIDSLPQLFIRTVNNPFVFYANKTDTILNFKNVNLFSRINNGIVKIQDYSPQKINFNCSNFEKSYLCLLQNYYPGWKVKVDNKQENIILANSSFMGVYLPPGEHKVEFYFDPINVKIAFWISIISLFLVFCWLCIIKFKK